MHRKPSRMRRAGKWCGLLVCALIVVAWGVSEFGVLGVTDAPGAAVGWVTLCKGSIYLSSAKMRVEGVFVWNAIEKAGSRKWLPGTYSANAWWVVNVPLWIPLGVAGVPAVILWRRDRRPNSGHCACGYDLTGNQSGTCPECGIEARCDAAPSSA